MRTNNHLERLNREIKRRTRVIGVFPNPESVLRIMGTWLIESNEAARGRRAIYSAGTYRKLLESDAPARLRQAAREQEQMRKA